MAYRYILEKYNGTNSRYTCPKCGRSHCFTRFIDTLTGQYLADDVGICDHKNNCGYRKSPKEFFEEQGGGYHSECRQFSPLNSPVKPLKEEVGFITMDAIKNLENRIGNENVLKGFLSAFFLQSDLQQVFSAYHIGTTKNGEVVFPQIDIQGRCRTAKIMAYDEKGHRIKGERDKVDWLHTRILKNMKKKKLQLFDWNLKQCLFGEHLLPSRPDDVVCLVESEKTAIICALRYPEYLWLACGGKGGLKPEMCQALAGRNVLLFPDADAVEDWKEKKGRLSFCRRIEMFEWYKNEPEESKRDIADIIIEELQQEALEKKQTTIQEEIKPTTVGDICQWVKELGIEPNRVQINL